MSHRLDPPHDRVTLSDDERASLAELERAFAGADAVRRPAEAATSGRRASARAWCLGHLLWVSRAGPGVVVIGLLVMLAALPSSVAVSALGAVLVLLGAALTIRRPWRRLRARLQRLGSRR